MTTEYPWEFFNLLPEGLIPKQNTEVITLEPIICLRCKKTTYIAEWDMIDSICDCNQLTEGLNNG